MLEHMEMLPYNNVIAATWRFQKGGCTVWLNLPFLAEDDNLSSLCDCQSTDVFSPADFLHMSY